MNADASKVIVADSLCGSCSSDNVTVYHQDFPEMRIVGMSVDEAAAHLTTNLEASLDAVSDPLHREPVRLAIEDALAFLSQKETPSPTKPR